MPRCSIGVDVGCEHVAAGVFDADGHLLGRAQDALEPVEQGSGVTEDSADAIWQRACGCVRAAVSRAGVEPSAVLGVCFSSPGGLVAIDDHGMPVSVSATGEPERNAIVGLDKRATDEADRVNASAHSALSYCGDGVGPENAVARLLWLKHHRPAEYTRAAAFLDLSEFLVYRATGLVARSRAVAGCHWLYLPHEDRWPWELFEQLGLGDIRAKGQLGGAFHDPGEPVAPLTPQAAEAMGVTAEAAVSSPLPDAAAGGIGLLGDRVEGRLAMVGGPFACHFACSREPVFASGVGGPARDAGVPGYWMSHASQGAFGILLDHVITDSSGYPELVRGAEATGRYPEDLLTERVAYLETREDNPARSLHVLDYHGGGRSPRQDASLRGMASDVSLDQDVDALARRYLATIQALCYGTRHIVEAMTRGGHRFNAIRACGQMANNPVWCRELADATGLPVELPRRGDPQLLGGALAAATAAGVYPSVAEAMAATVADVETIEPRMARAHLHEAKYQVYRRLYDDQMAQQELMART